MHQVVIEREPKSALAGARIQGLGQISRAPELGLIFRTKDISTPLLLGGGAVMGTVGTLIAYHTFDSLGHRGTVGKIALVLAGLAGVGTALQGLFMTAAGVGSIFTGGKMEM